MKKTLAMITILALVLTLGSNLLALDSRTAAADQTVGRYIITYKNSASTEALETARTGIVSQQGLVRNQYRNFKMQAVEMTAAVASQLRQNPNILAVEPDGVVKAVAETTDWGVTRVEAPVVQSSGYKGTGIKVGVIDTGIDLEHEDLSVKGGVNCITATASYDDDNGHGTHCAGTIAALDNEVGVLGVAPEASLYAVKVLDSTGSGYLSDVVEGIDWAVSNQMDVISMSLGASSGTTALQTACDNAYNQGLVVVAAAGNSGTSAGTGDNVGYPARYASVIAVAATDSADVRAYFSSTGPAVEVAAPGYSIYSTYLGNAYKYLSGTSMATPHVAGIMALYKQHFPALTNGELRALLQQSAKDLGAAGRDPLYGYGLVTANVTVNTEPVTSITVSSSADTVAVGKTLAMSAAVLPANAANPAVIWSVAAGTGTASISTDGILTGTTAGTVTVIAAAADGSGVTGSRPITVTATAAKATVTTVKTNAASYTRGSKVTITVTVKDAANGAINGASVNATLLLGAKTISSKTLKTGTAGTATWTYNTARTMTSGTYTVQAVTAGTAIFLTSTGTVTFTLR